MGGVLPLLLLPSLLLATSSQTAAATVLDLGGKWTVTTTNSSAMPWIPAAGKERQLPATVPGQIHTDLLAAGAIPEPFYGDGDADLAWVALSDWVYTRTFEVPATLLQHAHVQLVSLGIDTVADIYINERHVFFTDNMFHRIRLDVKRHLKAGANAIRVHFYSKPLEADRRAMSCDNATAIICPAGTKNPVQHPFNNVNYLRTEPCSFSWDWGPAYAPVGLWRPIYLQAYDTAVVRDITVVTTPHPARAGELHHGSGGVARGGQQQGLHQEAGLLLPRWGKHFRPDAADAFDASDQSEAAVIARAFRRTDRELDTTTWDVQLRVFLDAGVTDDQHTSPTTTDIQSTSGRVYVSINTNPPTVASVNAVVGGTATGKEVIVPLQIKDVKADQWMPNGFGSQPLYTVSAKFVPDSEASDESPFEVPYPLEDNALKGSAGNLSVRFGFRKVELVQNKLPGGKSYFFAVNGVPIPVKGSNWIPADAFESRVSRNTPNTTRLAPLFLALKTSHQNMIRNWGGGIYQRDSFYDLADEHGILVWEDLMWACAQYAVPPEYLASAAKEVQDNVRRMQSHPSIALWAGNNEDEHDMDIRNLMNTPAYLQAYSLLTFRTALANVAVIDTSRPTSGSSPSDGNETAAKPFSWDHQSQFYGDVHCYLYDVDNWDTTMYKRPRFMSEFGLQSWPSGLTMSAVLNSSQWYYDSPSAGRRNHHPQGQEQMLQQVSMHFHLPKTCNPNVNKPSSCQADKQMYSGWAQTLWLTQLNQALGYKIEIEHFRRIRTDCSETVPGCNMGRMFWQTNDIWQGASWAAIDYTGRYKMIQYMIQEAYAPVLVSADGSALHNTFSVTMINDHPNADWHLTGEIKLTMYSWQHGAIKSWIVPFDAPPASALKVATGIKTFEQLLSHGACPNNDATQCFLELSAFNGTADAATEPISRNWLLLSPFFDVVSMRDPRLNVTAVHSVSEDSVEASALGVASFEIAFKVTLTAEAIAAFVWLETEMPGRWSANGFVMTEHTKEVTFYADTSQGHHINNIQLLKSLHSGRWTNPKTGESTLALKPAGFGPTGSYQGGVFSLVDTSREYTGAGVG